MEAETPNSMETETPNSTNTNNNNNIEHNLKKGKNDGDNTNTNGNVSQNDNDKQRSWFYIDSSFFEPLNNLRTKHENKVPDKSQVPGEHEMGMVFIFCVIFGLLIGIFSSSKLVTLILLLSIFIVMTVIKPEVTDKIVASVVSGICTVYQQLRCRTTNKSFVFLTT